MSHLFVFLGCFLIFFVLETIYPERSLSPKRKLRVLFHGAVAFGNTIVSRIFLIIPLLWLSMKCEGAKWTVMAVLKPSLAFEFIMTILLVDLYEYAWHRLNHLSKFLWRFHRAHHIDEELDVTTALRFHVGELAISYLAKAFFVLIIGPSWQFYLVARLMISCFALFHHSNIHMSLSLQKILSFFLMTPRLHSGHHTLTKRTREANYSTIFVVWDTVFGSYQEPEEKELQSLGLPEKMNKVFDLKEFLILPWRR